MSQWKEDLIDTQTTLKARLASLAEFNRSETYDVMPPAEQALLAAEERAVAEYLGAVSARISYF